jgi:hypothetical protein
LGEFSPVGQLFSLGRFFQNYRKGPNFRLHFSTEKAMHNVILANKQVRPHFGLFSQTHLVTLATPEGVVKTTSKKVSEM